MCQKVEWWASELGSICPQQGVYIKNKTSQHLDLLFGPFEFPVFKNTSPFDFMTFFFFLKNSQYLLDV